MPVTTTRPCAVRMRSTAPANGVPSPSRNAAARASMPLPSASSVRNADAIAACARSLVTWTGFGRGMVLDIMKTTSGQGSSVHSLTRAGCGRQSFLAISGACERLAHIRKDGLDRDVIGASVAYGVVAVDPRAFSRRIIAGRFKDGGNRIEGPPVPGAGRPEDRDRAGAKRCGDMHQSRIVGDRYIGRSERQNGIA